MEYGILISGQLLIHKEYREGDKPICRTDAPDFEAGKRYFYLWVEDENAIRQVWGSEDIQPQPPEPTPSPDDELSDTEALSLITGGTI